MLLLGPWLLLVLPVEGPEAPSVVKLLLVAAETDMAEESSAMTDAGVTCKGVQECAGHHTAYRADTCATAGQHCWASCVLQL